MRFPKLKSIILVGLLVVGMVLLTGSTLFAGDGKPVIGFVVITFGDAYNDALMKGASKGAELFGFDLVCKNGQRDAAVQDKHVRSLITQKVDAILLQSVDPKRLRPAVAAAYDAGIPVITVNMWVDAPHAAYVGVDFWSEGRAVGEIIAEALDGKGKIVNVTGDLGSSCTIDRDGGMEEVLATYPNIKILDTQPAHWGREEAMLLAERFLKAYPDLDLIVTGSHAEALGVLSAIKEAGKEGQIKIVTYDLPKYVAEHVRKGDFYGTAYDVPTEIAYTAVKIAALTISSEYTSARWESATVPPECTKGLAWKKTFGSILTGSKKVTVKNIDKLLPDEAF